MSVDPSVLLMEQDLKQLVQDYPKLGQYVPRPQVEIDTRIIYDIKRYLAFRAETASIVRSVPAWETPLTRRWFNYRVSACSEWLLCQHQDVVAHPVPWHPTIDLYVRGTPFDVKVTYLPPGWTKAMTVKSPDKLADWYYKNQSWGNRYSLNNRLFVVVDGTWKDKANLSGIAAGVNLFHTSISGHLFRLASGVETGVILV